MSLTLIGKQHTFCVALPYVMLIVLSLVFPSCAEENGDPTVNFADIERLDEQTKASELVDNYHFIPLDSVPGGGLLNYLTKAEVDGGMSRLITRSLLR